MIVVDTNVLVYLFVRGQHSAEAMAVQLRDPEWIAPVLWRSEFRNALVLSVRQGMLPLAVAVSIAREAEFVMRGNEFRVDTGDVLRLADLSRCTAYDCEFVALAQARRVPIVTTDKQILRAFPSVAVSMKSFVD